MSKNGFTSTELLVSVLLFATLVLFIVSSSLAIKGCQKLGSQIDQHGMKSVVEEFWEGKDSKGE